MTWEIGAGWRPRAGPDLALLHGLVVLRLRDGRAFAPRIPSTEFDTPRALRAAAAFSGGRLRAAAAGRRAAPSAPATIADDATAIAFYTQAFDTLVGDSLGHVLMVLPDRRLLLSMNTATMDGSRALYGISQGRDDDQVARRAQLDQRARPCDDPRRHLNLFLMTYFGWPARASCGGQPRLHPRPRVRIDRIHPPAASDRPHWPRPIKLSAIWVPIAGLLAAVNLLFIVVGGFIYSGRVHGNPYGYGWDKTRIGIIVLLVSLLFWAFRHLVQDRTSLRLQARRYRRCRTQPPGCGADSDRARPTSGGRAVLRGGASSVGAPRSPGGSAGGGPGWIRRTTPSCPPAAG